MASNDTHRKTGNAASNNEDAFVGVSKLVGINALVKDEFAVLFGEEYVSEDVGGGRHG